MGNASSSGHGGGSSFPHDVTTQSGLTSLYNQRVISAEQVTRPMNSKGGGLIDHAGVRVTTVTGQQYLVHKGPDFGKSSQTVVVDAKHMSDQWTSHGPASTQGVTVGDYVKTGGPNYTPFDNCRTATNDMMKLGQK